MNNQYLIPANSKKAILHFGIFRTIDLVIFGIGVGFSLLMMSFVQSDVWLINVLIISPAIITGLLVFPVPNYHNVMTLIKSMWEFFTTRQKFIWKGWCVANEFKEETSKE